MRINIADPCLRVLGGHFFDRDMRIAAILAGNGHTVSVYGHKDADPAIGRLVPAGVSYSAIFRSDPFDADHFSWLPLGRQVQNHFLQAAIVAADIQRETVPADLWIWPTMYAVHLRASASIERPSAISGVIHNPLGIFGNATVSGMLWRGAARRVTRRGHEIRALGTMDEGLASEMKHVLGPFGLRVIARPHEPTVPVVRKKALKTVGLLGFQRTEKGQALAEALVLECATTGFDVIYQDSAAARMEAPETGGQVRRYGFVDDLAALVSETDLVVLPYLPGSYARRYSGIGGLAIACGVPVLAPAGTGISEMLQRYQTGDTFEEASIPSIMAAILRMRGDYQRHAESALRASALWAQSNGLSRHVADLAGAI